MPVMGTKTKYIFLIRNHNITVPHTSAQIAVRSCVQTNCIDI